MATSLQKVERQFNTSVALTRDSFEMLSHFETMYHKVERMIEQQCIYSTWIRIQFGENNPITFNTASNDKKENVIANLDIKVSGAGVANEFKFTAIWDPFDNGQNPTEKIQGLDDILADALNYEGDTNSEKLRGYIQFGYNIAGDESLVSPCYEMFLTAADSQVEWTSGIVTYSFTGHSILALDCDCNEFTYTECNEWDIMDFANWHLYYYYGDPDNKPYLINENDEPFKNSPKYKIDIPKVYFEQCKDHKITVPTTASQQTPWQYVLGCLNSSKETRMLEADKQIDEYVNDWDNLSTNELPYWDLYITDSDRTIHLVHCTPLADEGTEIKNSEGKSLRMDYPITWGLQKTNLVTKWSSSIDLSLYIVAKRKYLRATNQQKAKLDTAKQNYEEAELVRDSYVQQKEKESTESKSKVELPWNVQINPDGTIKMIQGPASPAQQAQAERVKEQGEQAIIQEIVNRSQNQQELYKLNTAVEEAKVKLNEAEKSYQEAYNKQFYDFEKYEASITMLGIPADIAPSSILTIIPRILENVPNRQAGYYAVTGCSHSINNQGKFETTIEVFRTKGLTD